MRPLIRRTPDGREVKGRSSAPEDTTPQQRLRRVKLDADDVRAIRADYAAGRWDQADLAYIYAASPNPRSAPW